MNIELGIIIALLIIAVICIICCMITSMFINYNNIIYPVDHKDYEVHKYTTYGGNVFYKVYFRPKNWYYFWKVPIKEYNEGYVSRGKWTPVIFNELWEVDKAIAIKSSMQRDKLNNRIKKVEIL